MGFFTQNKTSNSLILSVSFLFRTRFIILYKRLHCVRVFLRFTTGTMNFSMNWIKWIGNFIVSLGSFQALYSFVMSVNLRWFSSISLCFFPLISTRSLQPTLSVSRLAFPPSRWLFLTLCHFNAHFSSSRIRLIRQSHQRRYLYCCVSSLCTRQVKWMV